MVDELRIEEEQELLKRIAHLTERGKIKWECVVYNPLCFMNEDKVEDSSAYLSQMFTLTTKIEGIPYELDIAEYITIPDGKGDISLTLSKNTADDFIKIDTSLSFDEAYDELLPEEIANAYKGNPVMRLTAAVIPQVSDSETVKEAFKWARFINEINISDELLNNPITLLAEKLFNDQRVLDYHKILFDISYRNAISAE